MARLLDGSNRMPANAHKPMYRVHVYVCEVPQKRVSVEFSPTVDAHHPTDALHVPPRIAHAHSLPAGWFCTSFGIETTSNFAYRY